MISRNEIPHPAVAPPADSIKYPARAPSNELVLETGKFGEKNVRTNTGCNDNL